jgi:cyanophycinase
MSGMKPILVSALWSLSLAACVANEVRPAAQVRLVIVGGGGTTEAIQRRALELARGADTRVVVLPQASERADRGEESAQMWRDAGAKEAINLSDLADVERARKLLSEADMIWFGGGDQSLLMRDLRAAGLLELVRARAAAGIVCGGTSAGAAVMSRVMITGDGKDELVRINANVTATAEGLGLLEGAIVDQHFLARQRTNRLVAAVLDHPELVGVGIDERTALVVRGARGEVVGEGQVVFFDARGARVETTESEQRAAAGPLRMHVLRDGMACELWP